MKAWSTQRIGAVAALGVAGCSLAFALFVLLTPVSVLASAETARTLLAADYALLLAALFGLAVVPAVTAHIDSQAPGWARYTATLGQLGFAVLAVVSGWQVEYETALTDAVLSSFPLDAAAIPLGAETGTHINLLWVELVSRAPRGWLDAAAVGLWMLTVGWLGRGVFPDDLNSLGRVAGAVALCVPLGVALGLAPLLTLGVLGWVVMQPLWFGWTGVVLLRAETARSPRLRLLTRRTRRLVRFFHLDRPATSPFDPSAPASVGPSLT